MEFCPLVFYDKKRGAVAGREYQMKAKVSKERVNRY